MSDQVAANRSQKTVSATAVIPARYASTRFPGKPLANKTGKYLIQHVYERAAAASAIQRVIVATDDRRIVQAVESFGGVAVLTRADHPSGTDRVAEVAANIDAEIIINLQGDEPDLEPAFVDRLVERMSTDAACPMGTLACPFAAIPGADPADPHAVKVAIDTEGHALYFSRSLIPYPAETATAAGPLLHLGIYAYRRTFLLQLAALSPTPLERTERLEQLRAIEHGHRIAVVLVEKAAVGVDTPEDYEAFVQRHRSE